MEATTATVSRGPSRTPTNRSWGTTNPSRSPTATSSSGTSPSIHACSSEALAYPRSSRFAGSGIWAVSSENVLLPPSTTTRSGARFETTVTPWAAATRWIGSAFPVPSTVVANESTASTNHARRPSFRSPATR